MTVDEVLDEVEKDASFYRNTGGGITLSGGECLLQPDFSAALLKGAHERGFNTAIETACNVPWAYVEKVLPHVDTMLHDHKMTIPERHKKWVGVGNERILANFKKAYETFPDVDFIARTPLIPGINADEEHIRAVLAFIRPYKNVIDYELLPYHRFGLGKYELLGEVYELDDYKTPSDDLVAHLQAIIDEAFGRGELKSRRRRRDLSRRIPGALLSMFVAMTWARAAQAQATEEKPPVASSAEADARQPARQNPGVQRPRLLRSLVDRDPGPDRQHVLAPVRAAVRESPGPLIAAHVEGSGGRRHDDVRSRRLQRLRRLPVRHEARNELRRGTAGHGSHGHRARDRNGEMAGRPRRDLLRREVPGGAEGRP